MPACPSRSQRRGILSFSHSAWRGDTQLGSFATSAAHFSGQQPMERDAALQTPAMRPRSFAVRISGRSFSSPRAFVASPSKMILTSWPLLVRSFAYQMACMMEHPLYLKITNRNFLPIMCCLVCLVWLFFFDLN